jgi:predicted transposase YdaD
VGWQAGRQAGRQTGSKAGRQADRQAGRKAGEQEGRKECKRAEMQVDRQTEVGKTDVQIYLQTNGNKDLQTDTDKQTDRRTVQKYWYRVKNRQMD